MSSSTVACPLCSSDVASDQLNRHLRKELHYCAWFCGICDVKFATLVDAKQHFRPFNSHPGEAEFVLEFRDEASERRLDQLLGQTLKDAAADASELEDAPPRSPEAEEEAPESKAGIVKAKAEAAVNGKVACLSCDQVVMKSFFRLHVMEKHLGLKPFVCNLCPAKLTRRMEMRKHLKKAHEGADPGAFTDLTPTMGKRIAELLAACFGDVSAVVATKYACAACGSDVALTSLREHVALKHLRKPVYECRLCPYSVLNWYAGTMKAHARKVHGADFDDASVNSHQDELKPTMAALMGQLFQQS